MDIKEQYEKLLRYCYMKTKDRTLAEDIVQETYLRFWQSHSYKETGKELAYLYTIARNLCVDEFRKLAPENIENVSDIIPDGKSDVEKSIARMDIEAALEKLPDDIREMVLLRYTNEMSVTDIAKITGVSRFAIHRKLKKGIELLKKTMEGGEAYD